MIYSTCRDCGGLLHVTGSETTHPLCADKPTKVERMVEDWIAAVLNGNIQIADEIEVAINEIDCRPPRMLAAALLYASWGWPVFPLRTGQKRPATRNGFKDSTTNSDRIRSWWNRHPGNNIGLQTGIAFDVIDIDVPDGIPTYQLIAAQDRKVHGFVATSSGGIHLYIKPTGKGCSTRWQPGADYRGQGGYVVAPPSTLGTPGRSWSWQHKPSPLITGVGDTYGIR